MLFSVGQQVTLIDTEFFEPDMRVMEPGADIRKLINERLAPKPELFTVIGSQPSAEYHIVYQLRAGDGSVWETQPLRWYGGDSFSEMNAGYIDNHGAVTYVITQTVDEKGIVPDRPGKQRRTYTKHDGTIKSLRTLEGLFGKVPSYMDARRQEASALFIECMQEAMPKPDQPVFKPSFKRRAVFLKSIPIDHESGERRLTDYYQAFREDDESFVIFVIYGEKEYDGRVYELDLLAKSIERDRKNNMQLTAAWEIAVEKNWIQPLY